MSEYVIMPKADYTAACNAIRTKTGKADLIKSGDMEGEILGITSGGGSSADVRYVTFMNDDGTVELGKKAVATGDDCADPIARGVFSTPAKESTAQYTYTFYGWATTPNGAADSNSLKAVEEDRTVYANFVSAVRYYTITYYDSDGTTVLKTESLAYGATPSYTPTKEGSSFEKWNPDPYKVNGDASYTAQWKEKVTFSGGSWSDIARICEAGDAKKYFAVGDKKTITVGDTNVSLIVIGFDHDMLYDGTGKAGMTILSTTALSNTTTGAHSVVRNFLINTIKPMLPSDLQPHIKRVSKPVDNTTKNAVITPTEMFYDLFPLSYDEMKIQAHGTRRKNDNDWRNYVAELGTPYEYFEKIYSSTYFGPGYSWPNAMIGSWLRQYFRMNDDMYMCGKRSMTSSSKSFIYSDIISYANSKTVCFAFCI